MSGDRNRGDLDAQRQRFEQAARELGVDLDEDKLKETLRQMKDRPHDSGQPPEGGGQGKRED